MPPSRTSAATSNEYYPSDQNVLNRRRRNDAFLGRMLSEHRRERWGALGAGMWASVRIGLDARYAFRSQRRGIGEYVAALLAHLPAVANEDDRFVLFVDRQANRQALPITDPRFTVQVLATSNPLLWEEIALPAAARRARLDLLHLTSNYGPSRPPCPTVYTIHDTIEFLRSSFGRPNLSFRHALGRNVRVRTLPAQARRAQAIITVSKTSRGDIARWLGVAPEGVRVIPLGVSDEFRPAADPGAVRMALHDAGFPPEVPFVLALGALDPRKNGAVLIDAFQRVHEVMPELELRVIGIERPDAYPVPFPACPDWLRLTGFVSRATLIVLLQAASVFVYPSLYEGFGLPPLQAMACGAPVIVSDHPALVETIGDAAVRFAATDAEALATAILGVLTDPAERARLAHGGPEHAGCFTWGKTARETYATYRAALLRAQGSAA